MGTGVEDAAKALPTREFFQRSIRAWGLIPFVSIVMIWKMQSWRPARFRKVCRWCCRDSKIIHCKHIGVGYVE